MDLHVPILFFCVIAVSCFPSGFASSPVDFSVCNHEFELFRFDLHSKCPLSLHPSPPIKVDGDSLDRLMALNHDGNAFMSVLFYASWCPFSRAVRPKFDVLSSMFPQIQHLSVEHSQALPSVFSRYGIHSLPSIVMVNQTFKARYRGRKDLTSLIEFYEESTGLKPVQYVAEAEPATTLDTTNDNLITWLHNGASISEIFKRDPFLVLSLLFLCLRMAILVFPIAESRMKALWASYVPNLNLERFGEVSQVFSRALHMVDVRRLWLKLRLVKTRNFHERAKNAQAWASSLASVSLGQTSSDQS
ncbi:5'-adenylylsulfate reductase-like 5 [Raphanus sativus]|uniref:5'-adenylylsulfate reductase-like 5 n=1 Tax=Raphanus sativus TaxID=3726 RepID=A0A6J0P2T7_RAPSA|nr:5'-adenylylsulfate reductase-like 5 [Raphanus sativus]KAJ4898550.1 5'-adenylylsulfate reductase-like 5 [Raphanus sativus]